MNDYGKLPEEKPKCKLFTQKIHKNIKHFHRDSVKWVAAKDLNTIFKYGDNDFALVGINKKTNRWGIVKIEMCLSKKMFK